MKHRSAADDALQRHRRRRFVRAAFAVLAAPTLVVALTAPALAKGAPNTTITSAPAALTSATTASFSFTSNTAASTFSCTLDGTVAACTSPAAYSGLAPGSHTFSVAATANGQTDLTPAQAGWRVDTSPPPAPTLTASTPSPTSVALSWQQAADDTGVTGSQVTRDGALLATVAGAATTYSDTAVTAGSTHTYVVRALDGAGNISPDSNAVTTTTPTSAAQPETVIDSGPVAATSASTATFTFHATTPGASFTCALDASRAAGCSSPRSYAGLAQGSHTFKVTATSSGVSDPTPATATWVVDTTSPSAPTGLTAVAASATAIGLTWVASTDNVAVAGYDVARDGTLLETVAGTTFTDSTVTTGTFYRYTVSARDQAGNSSLPSSNATARSMAPYDPHLSRAPYLTDLVGSHVAINFATDRSATAASVLYGAVDGAGGCTPSVAVPAGRTSIQVGTVGEYQWTAQVDLPAQGTYCYRAYLAGADLLGANPAPRFTTQEAFGSTAPFSFGVLGDWGQVAGDGTNRDQSNLLTQIAVSGARFVVTTGDNGYPNGNQINYGDLHQTGADTSAIFGPTQWTVPGATVPLLTAAGNHGLAGTTHTDITTWTQSEIVKRSGGRYQNDVYCCVNGTSPQNYASEWYAFDAGNARFYVLDSAWSDSNLGTGDPYANDAAAHFAPGTPEYEWLLHDLETHGSQLKFAFGHFPLYADNPDEGSDPYLQGPANLEGLLGTHGVQMVFNGHAHVYERNTPSADGMPITYVTGGGGATLQPIGPCSPLDAYGIGWSPSKNLGSACGSAKPRTAAANVYHFLKVTVSGASVTVTPTDSLGNTFDVRTYTFKVSPDTYLDAQPAAGTTSSTATLAFHASGSPATFTCQLDQGAQTPCVSPVTYTGLSEGPHVFNVAATVNKQLDRSPAVAEWTVDSTPPEAPADLSAQAITPFEVDLGWTAPSDNTGVTGYRLYRDGSPVKSLGTTTACTDPVLGGSTHSYEVTALDVAGNESPRSAAVTITTPPPPSPVFADGFESGDLSAWSSSSGLVVQSATARTGVFAAEASTVDGKTYAKKTLPASYADGYARVVANVLSASSQINLLRLRDAASSSLAYVYVDATGHLGLHNDALGTTVTSPVLVTDGWHAVELRRSANAEPASATGALQVWLDNVLVDELSSTAVNAGDASTAGLQIGETQDGRSYDVVLDDVAFGTSRLGPVSDATAPSTPSGLTATAAPFQVDLSWAASTDDVAVASYDVFRDGSRVATVVSPSFTDSTVLAETSHEYAVLARDSSGNLSLLSDPMTVTTPAPEDAVFSDGFESGDLTGWTSKAGLVVQSTDVRSGLWAAQGSTTTGATWAKKTLPSSTYDGYARVGFEVHSQASIVGLLRLSTAAGSLAHVQQETSGKLSFRNDLTGISRSSTVLPGPGWHVLELHLDVTNGAVETWLDGTPLPELTFAADLGSSPIIGLQVGEATTGRTYDVVFDDAAFGTSRRGLS